MSCISSNFSSFFLNSLNDPSEFSKYLSNGELRFSAANAAAVGQYEDFQVYGQAATQQQQHHQHFQQQQQLQLQQHNGTVTDINEEQHLENTQYAGNYASQQQQQHLHHQQLPHHQQLQQQQQQQHRWNGAQPQNVAGSSNNGHFDGSFEFMKYLRHSNDCTESNDNQSNGHAHHHHHHAQHQPHPIAVGTKPDAAALTDLDTNPKQRSSRKTPALLSSNNNITNSSLTSANNNINNNNSSSNSNNSNTTPMIIDAAYDHDSKHTLYDLHHMNSASNESSMDISTSTMAYSNSHLNASNSNTSSEGCNANSNLTSAGGAAVAGQQNDFSMLGGVTQSSNAAAGGTVAATNAAAAAAATASPAAPKILATFNITENFEAHPSHKVEEGIFQHMNKLPGKKKDTLKQLGVRFTGQMTLNDKSIIVENFIKFCQEYEIQDHRPFLSLNQSGLQKPDQIKFARYLGQGLPTFTLFCIYSNFKNLFCTKRTEIYTKEGYNLPYILDKTKQFLANTTADLKNIINQQSNDEMDFQLPTTTTTATALAPTSMQATSTNNNYNNNSNNLNNFNTALNTTLPPPPLHRTQQQQHHNQQQPQSPQATPSPLTLKHPTSNPLMVDYNLKGFGNEMGTTTLTGPQQQQLPCSSSSASRPLENFQIYDNFDVHESHRIEEGICTQLSRLPSKKQEILKQFGIQSNNQTVTYYEKYILIENFNRFCNEYKVADHRPFLDVQESGLPRPEQLKFVRYLGQGLPNLTLNKLYLLFKDLLGLNKIEKMIADGYNLDFLLKKKKKNLYNRMSAAAVHKECHPESNVNIIPAHISSQKNNNQNTDTTGGPGIGKPASSQAPPPPAPCLTTTATTKPLMPIFHQDAYNT